MNDNETPIRVLHTAKGLFDPAGRELTPDEKAHPLTFFGVTAEMRAERLMAMAQQERQHRREQTPQDRAKPAYERECLDRDSDRER